MKSWILRILSSIYLLMGACGSNPMGNTSVTDTNFQPSLNNKITVTVSTNECPTTASGSLNLSLGSNQVYGSAAVTCTVTSVSSSFQGTASCSCTSGTCSVTGLTLTSSFLTSMTPGQSSTISSGLAFQLNSSSQFVTGTAGITVNASTWSPTCMGSALTLWYDGSSTSSLFNDTAGSTAITNGAGVGLWKDLSGNGYDATQSIAADKPTYSTSTHSLNFNGSTDFLTSALTAGTFNGSSGSMIAMLSQNAANGADAGILDFRFVAGNNTGLIYYNTTTYGWDWGTSTAYNWNTGLVPTTGQFGVVALVNNSSTGVLMSLNGNTASTTAYLGVSSTVNSGINLVLGNDSGGAGRYYNGRMAEVIVSTTAISASVRQQIEGYMSWKWGTQSYLVSSHPYYSAAP